MDIKQAKRYDALDLAKFIFSILIVALHSELFPSILQPWMRLAVPMFFLISGFLFFSRTATLPREKQNAALVKTAKRNLVLYGIWFVILLPITLHVRSAWFADGVWKGLLILFKNFFLGSTFMASWFIIANLISIILIFFLAKKCNTFSLLLITGALNILCCCFSAYDGVPAFSTMDKAITPYIGSIKNNFVVALFWTALGKAFADGSIRVPKKKALFLTLFSFALLWCERFLNMKLLHTQGNADCFLMLIPSCLFLFAFLLQLENVTFKNAKLLRNMSTLIYVIHYAVIVCLAKFNGYFGAYASMAYFTGACLVSLIAGFCIIKLSETKRLKFLKYLY